VADMFVVVWCAVRPRARSFSLSILCLFAWLDCTVADKHSLAWRSLRATTSYFDKASASCQCQTSGNTCNIEDEQVRRGFVNRLVKIWAQCCYLMLLDR
jgi:hypothetical protein